MSEDASFSESGGSMHAEATQCSPLDAALGGCDRSAADALRARATEDPLLMIALAEEVAFLERFRELRVTPSQHYEIALQAVVRRSQRRLPVPVPVVQRPWFVLLAAAVITFAILYVLDPLARRSQQDLVANSLTMRPALVMPSGELRGELRGEQLEDLAGPVVASKPSPYLSSIGAMRDRFELEQSSALRDALAGALEPSSDPLSRWLDPKNTVALMRVDHEVRARHEVRRQALLSQGGLAAADQRVQQFADELAIELPRRFAAVPFEPKPSLSDVAMVVRALLAAGPTSAERGAAVDDGTDWIANHLPNADTKDAVAGLAALVESCAVYGRHVAAVHREGERLLDSVLRLESDWQRGRPELLGAQLPPAVVGEAARVLRYLPAFGLSAARCELVRNLLVGTLRERIARGADGPEYFAAIVYGAADLLSETERYDLERRLRRWQPVHLAPDFVTLQQLVWGIQPGRGGFTRLQWQLRPLAALARPQDMADRAALALCLAASYAAPRGDFLQQVARVAGGS